MKTPITTAFPKWLTGIKHLAHLRHGGFPQGWATLRAGVFAAGESSNFVQANANKHALCAPDRALKEKILLTQTVVKLAPKPVKKIIGNLSDAAIIRATLELEATH